MHYFFEDLTGFAAATVLVLMLVVVPGFGIARIADRARLLDTEGFADPCWGLVLGPTILPALDALLLRWTGFGGMLTIHLVLFALGARAAFKTACLAPRVLWPAVALGWLLVAWANLDIDWNGQLYQPVTVIDGVKHSAVVASLARYGLPLHDPFFARPGIAGYYYYFYLAPALIHRIGLGLIDSRVAFAASTFATLLAFPAMLIRLADESALIPAGARQRFSRLVLLLSCLSGFDLLPGVWTWFMTGNVYAQLDWWNEEVRWGLTSVLWVPHHVTAVIAVYTGCLLLTATTGGRPIHRVIIAGVAFATAFGCSLWIALAAVPILAIWWLCERIRQSPSPMWALPLSGIVALLLSVPQISDIYAGRAMSGPPLALYLRSVGPTRVVPHGLNQWIGHLAVIPGGYLIEFGIFGLGSILFLAHGRIKDTRSTPVGRLLLLSAPIALVMVTFIRSAVIYNDFGWRAIWFTQAPALLWTASILVSRPMQMRTSLFWSTAFVLGLAATVWDVVGMRLIRPFYILDWANANPAVDYDSRGAYRWIEHNLPEDMIVQHNPTQGYRALDFGLYGERPVAVADVEARLFGADDGAVQSRIAALAPIFDRSMSFAELKQRAAASEVGAILLTSADPLWRTGNGPPRNWICGYRSMHSCVMVIQKERTGRQEG